MSTTRNLAAPTLITALLLASPMSWAGKNTGINWAWILFGGWFVKLHNLEVKGIGGAPDSEKSINVTAFFEVNGYCLNPAENQVTGTSARSSAGIEFNYDNVKTIEKNGKTYIEELHFDPEFDRTLNRCDDPTLGDGEACYDEQFDFYRQLYNNCPNPNWYLLNEDPDVDCDGGILGKEVKGDCYPDRTSVYASSIELHISITSGGKTKPTQISKCTLNEPDYTTAPDADNCNVFWVDDWIPGSLTGPKVTIDHDFVLLQGTPDNHFNEYTCTEL